MWFKAHYKIANSSVGVDSHLMMSLSGSAPAPPPMSGLALMSLGCIHSALEDGHPTAITSVMMSPHPNGIRIMYISVYAAINRETSQECSHPPWCLSLSLKPLPKMPSLYPEPPPPPILQPTITITARPQDEAALYKQPFVIIKILSLPSNFLSLLRKLFVASFDKWW